MNYFDLAPPPLYEANFVEFLCFRYPSRYFPRRRPVGWQLPRLSFESLSLVEALAVAPLVAMSYEIVHLILLFVGPAIVLQPLFYVLVPK